MKSSKPLICCLDMEGVLVPEIWIAVAKSTRVSELRLTTRDISDYDVLMRRRLAILRERRIRLADIQKVIRKLKPLPGAAAFLKQLRAQTQVVILSDTFYEFAMPLMQKLDYPALLCNSLTVDSDGFIANYHLRQQNGKEHAVRAFKQIGFRVHAAGDSYNDLTMLRHSDKGILFQPPDSIAREFPKLPVTRDYKALSRQLLS